MVSTLSYDIDNPNVASLQDHGCGFKREALTQCRLEEVSLLLYYGGLVYHLHPDDVQSYYIAATEKY